MSGRKRGLPEENFVPQDGGRETGDQDIVRGSQEDGAKKQRREEPVEEKENVNRQNGERKEAQSGMQPSARGPNCACFSPDEEKRLLEKKDGWLEFLRAQFPSWWQKAQNSFNSNHYFFTVIFWVQENYFLPDPTLQEPPKKGEVLRKKPAFLSSRPKNTNLDPQSFLFLSAVKGGQPGDVQRLLKEGADAKTQDADGVSALRHAAERKEPCPEILNMLVQAGADVDAPDAEGRTPLLQASGFGYPVIVEALLEAGADVKAVDKFGESAVHLAARRAKPCPTILQKLLKAGADVNSPNKDGWSALHSAVVRDKPCREIVQMLVEAGADTTALTADGRSAADVASFLHRTEIVEYLQLAKSSQELQADGLWGLPEKPWGEAVRILQWISGSGEKGNGRVISRSNNSAAPLPSGGAASPLSSAPVAAAAAAASCASAHSAKSAPARSLSFVINEGKKALTRVEKTLTQADSFRALQASLRERVERENSSYLSCTDTARRASFPCPLESEVTARRDQRRGELREVLRDAILCGSSALKGLNDFADPAWGTGSGGCVSVEVVAERLKCACDELWVGSEPEHRQHPPPSGAESLSRLSDQRLCMHILSLADKWVVGRKAAVREARAKTAAARKRFAKEFVLESSSLPDTKTCAEMEEAERAQAELLDQMSRLEDVHSSGQKGKEVVGEIVGMCREVVRRLREVMSLSSLLERAEREAGQIDQACSLSGKKEGERENICGQKLLASPLAALKSLLEEHEEQVNKEKELELEQELARLRKKEEEVCRLESVLQQVREKSKGKDLPASIARERARLLSLASLHFPELLWEGGTFLPLVRLDVQEVVRAEAPSMLERGVLVQGRSCRRDFINETVISKPGRLARVSSCSDMQGREWVLKRYEIEGGPGSRHFYRQAAMLQELQHPHLMQVTAVWQEGIFGFVQTPKYQGGDLAAWMDARPAEGGRDPSESLRLAEDFLSALSFLHQRGKVHCDVKPKNIFLTAAGRGVLGDMDGVKDVNPSTSDNPLLFPATTILHTTVGYVAPEVIRRERITPAGDVFAAGVVLEELLGGGVLEGQPERAAALQELVGRMRSENPSDRPSAEEALECRLFSRETAQTAQCIVCYEVVLCSRGLSCTAPSPHFLCAPCLNGHVESQARVDAEYSDIRARFKAGDCKVTCVHVGCPSEPFSAPALSRHLNRETHALWEGARVEASEERVRREMEDEFTERLRKALEEGEVQKKVREITEDILTLKCPRCRAAFVDFDGCAALTCGSCNCGFCGYCLKDCLRDAHGHVPRCPVAKVVGARLNVRFGMYPPSFQDWERFQKERQTDRVREVLQRLSAEERDKVTELLQPLLQEGGIEL
uniref:Protein kinase domain-containing protein n=1 Tax=Chromera velia CCMP2878 TaxID=1169474 RepID=A0A0K6SAB1_9ALVE|eukprot:Cvel_10155.t1-p1 / transcript=Cvel_10155.t1 / gene=Cvel_10155 / organism=Chromera_velia_CCMP2878 / gene_product=Putative ankyrin repeat protein MM_0045, putative / transcript_product=Putative ankyrin repeat protein MM_0045, putative / location=Cvel_scaffold606:1674-8058(-) / protein_length=1355 / sequence_SO=supercontig / SO=protein_coding / is_pseudo=false